MEDPSPPLLRPIPRRPFDFTRSSTDSQPETAPNSPDPGACAEFTRSSGGGVGSRDEGTSLGSSLAGGSRSRSILNLTSSTLFGIYAPSTYSDGRGDYSEPATPWGTGAETPSRLGSFETDSDRLAAAQPKLVRAANQQLLQQQQVHASAAPLAYVLRVVALFAFGVLYGVLVSHLHDNQNIAPVRVEGLDHGSWQYLAFWGVAGVALGSLLPVVDGWLEERDEGAGRREKAVDSTRDGSRGNVEEMGWSRMIRSIGAFVGIAFAIRKLPWKSTLQVSVTLALVNPVLWYILDRSRPGILLSTAVGLAGSTISLLLNPEWVPSPTPAGIYRGGNSSELAGQGEATEMLGGLVSYESIGVATWIASVFFCSSICFGNIGRKLAPPEAKRGAAQRWAS